MHFPSLRAAAAAVILSLAPCAALQAQTGEGAASPALDSLIAAEMTGAGIMGMAAAVLVDREVVWMQGYGFSDGGRARAFSPGTVMSVGSVAKPVTGVAVMQLVQEGRLDLHEDINRYLPFRVTNPHRPGERITLWHLATHTSGITDRWEVYADSYHFGGDSPVPLGDFLADYFAEGGEHSSDANFLDVAPGTLREYSNIGTALAGYIVEQVSGMPLNVWTRTHVFEPLGMEDTGWFLSEVDAEKHSTLFVSQGGFAIPIQHYGLTTWPDGGLRTSVADLSRFFAAMLRGGDYDGARILDGEWAAEMQRFQFDDTNRPENFPAEDGNTGLFWRTKFNGERVGYGGNDPGVQAEMLANRSGDIAVITLMNTSVSGADGAASVRIFQALWAFAEAMRASEGAGR